MNDPPVPQPPSPLSSWPNLERAIAAFLDQREERYRKEDEEREERYRREFKEAEKRHEEQRRSNNKQFMATIMAIVKEGMTSVLQILESEVDERAQPAIEHECKPAITQDATQPQHVIDLQLDVSDVTSSFLSNAAAEHATSEAAPTEEIVEVESFIIRESVFFTIGLF